jgi:DNA-binding CsgD family transcriptional regulator
MLALSKGGLLADRELGYLVKEAVEGDPERGLAILSLERQVIYSNGALRAHLRDATPRGLDPLLPAVVDQWLLAFATRARVARALPPADLPYPSETDRRLNLVVEAMPRLQGALLVLRSAPASPHPEPSVRRLQARHLLTLREAQVALGVSRGLSNAEVAARLGVVEKTVKNVLMGVFAKCRVRNRVELALRAHEIPMPDPGERS